MAKITEAIDLTLDARFAGESSPRLFPYRWQAHHTGFTQSAWRFFKHFCLSDAMRQHLDGIFPNHEIQQFFAPPRVETTGFYYHLFKAVPPTAYAELVGEGYDPELCMRCGRALNVLNSNKVYDLCERCAQSESMRGEGEPRPWRVFSVTT